MEIWVCFYRPAIDGHVLDNAIYGWTSLWNRKAVRAELACSHAEIYIPHRGVTYTSTMQNGNGVVCRFSQDIFKHPERWFYYKLHISEHEMSELRAWLDVKTADNQGYDRLAILSFFLPVRIHNKKKYICSEFCHQALAKLVSVVDTTHILKSYPGLNSSPVPSPIRLAWWLKRMGLTPFELSTNQPI